MMLVRYLIAGRSKNAVQFEDDVIEGRPQRRAVMPTLQHQVVPAETTTHATFHTKRQKMGILYPQ